MNLVNVPNADAAGQAKGKAKQAITAVIGEMPDKLPKEKVEMTSKRSKYSTRYLNPDGTFTEEIFLDPQFYLDPADKGWKKIDNKLRVSMKKAGKFENTANEFTALFAAQTGADEVAALERDGKSVGLIPVGAKQVKGTVQEDAITYAGAFENADVRYQAQGAGVKEDLILHALAKQKTFSFELKQKGVKATVDKDGLIAFTDAVGEKVWYLEKPFMTDANGKYSEEVEMKLREEGGKTFVDVTPNAEFLQDQTTKYPVTIDPTINNWDIMRDMFVGSNYPNSSFSSESIMTTGYHDYFGASRSMAQFYLPSLPSGATISSATVNFYQQKVDASNAAVDLHRITSPWNGTATWNTQPTIKATAESSVTGNTSNTYWSWYITQLVKDWYNGVQPNYGMMLKQQNETTSPFRTFTSVNAGNNTPRLTVNYKVEALGLEGFWGYSKDGVNVSNGNLVTQETDLTISGRGIPVELQRTYNSRSTGSGMFGYGWWSNWDLRLVDSGDGPITLIDEDFTRHIFGQRADGVYQAAGGVYLDLVKNADGTYTITSPEGTKTHFNTAGKLVSIVDTNGNATTFTYDAAGKLTTVKDASGRSTLLTHHASGQVASVTDPAGRVIGYSYDTVGNLTKKTDAAGAATLYAYDAARNLSSITDARNNATTITYDASDRVATISRPLTVDGVKKTSTATYTYDAANLWTTVVDGEGRRIDFSHNANGNVTQIIENPTDAATKAVTKFGYDNHNNLTEITDPNVNASGGTASTVYAYDAKGNVTAVQLPEQQQANFSYNGQNDLIRAEDFKSNVDQFGYDGQRNETEATDPYSQTVSSRYESNGNMKYTTHAMSVADNLVQNSGFETDENSDGWPDLWTKAVEPTKTAAFSYSAVSKFGGKSISIANPTGWAIVSNDQIIDYAAGNEYVVSGYVKTVAGSTLAGSSAALVKVEYLDSSLKWLGEEQSNLLKGDQDWTRLYEVIDNVPANTAKLRLSVGLTPGNGTAYFDGLQLEKGNVLSAYNLIDNASFERDSNGDKLPNNWTTSGNLAAVDGIDSQYYVGQSSFKLTGESGKNKYVKQRVNVSGEAGARMTLSGWSKQSGANPNGGYYNLQVAINHRDGTVDWSHANAFDRTIAGWQHIAAEVKAAKAFDSIDIYGYYYDQTGTAWFDALRLEQGASHTAYTYDANGNYATQVKDPLGNSVTTAYDKVGNLIHVTDAKQAVTQYSYDARNRVTKVTDALGGVTGYTYDAEGNRTSVTDANGRATAFEYNEWNLLSKINNPLNQSIQFGYDLNGNQTKVTYPNGNRIGYTFDALNRKNGVFYNDSKRWTFGYDTTGNLTSVTDAAGLTTSYAYDKNSRLIDEQVGAVNRMQYQYDKNDNLQKLTATAGSVSMSTEYSYNSLDQMTKLAKNGANQAKFLYDERGNLTSVVRANGTTSTYRFDDANRLSEVKNYDKQGVLISAFSYSYDANGNRTGVNTLGGVIAYQYDALQRLTQEKLADGTVIDYAYDKVGNRTSKTVTEGGAISQVVYDYDAANRIKQVGTQAYKYDANGNLLEDGKKVYLYDEANRLKEVKDTAGASLAAFTYDHDGKRTSMTTPQGKVNYQYQGDKVIYETDANNQVIAEYAWDALGNPVTMTRGGKTYFYHLNGHGDVIALTDAEGNVAAKYDYDAWGNTRSKSGMMADVNPYRYASYRFDEATGLYYLMARYYDADTARFLTQDTYYGKESDSRSLNLYAYTNNNPVMFIDPDGHYAVILRLLWAALGKYAWKFGSKAIKKAYDVAYKEVKKALKDSKNYRIDGPKKTGKNAYQFVQIFNRKTGKPIFRLEMNNVDGKSSFHYHIEPNMKKHHELWPKVRTF